MDTPAIEGQLQALVESLHGQLRGCVVVEYKGNRPFLYQASKTKGNKIKVIFTSHSFTNPFPLDVVRRAARSALEIRRGTTKASIMAGIQREGGDDV